MVAPSCKYLKMKKVMGLYRCIPNVSSWIQSISVESPKIFKDTWGHTGDLTASCFFHRVPARSLSYPFCHRPICTGDQAGAQHTVLFVTKYYKFQNVDGLEGINGTHWLEVAQNEYDNRNLIRNQRERWLTNTKVVAWWDHLNISLVKLKKRRLGN